MRQTFNQEADFRQLRDFGQKISATFEFIGEHWRGLGKALLCIVLPAALLQGMVAATLQQLVLLPAGGRSSSNSGLALLNLLRTSPTYWVSVAAGAVFVTLLVLTVYSYVLCCLRPVPSPAPIAVREVWAVVKDQFLSSFLSYFALMLVVIVAAFFLLIPAIYLGVALSLFYVVKVMEHTGFGDTFQRCLQLTRGKWWSSFGLLVVMLMLLSLLVVVIGGVVRTVFTGLGYSLFRSWFSQGTTAMGLFTVITTALGGLLNLLIYPPLLLALAFQYFNLVERHDGVGLRNLLNQLGQPPAAVRSATYQPDEEGEY